MQSVSTSITFHIHDWFTNSFELLSQVVVIFAESHIKDLILIDVKYFLAIFYYVFLVFVGVEFCLFL
jgi:hypothetical protein